MKSVKVSHLDLGATRRSMGLLRATPTTPTIGERDLLSCWLLKPWQMGSSSICHGYEANLRSRSRPESATQMLQLAL